jgi:hypothetical protein
MGVRWGGTILRAGTQYWLKMLTSCGSGLGDECIQNYVGVYGKGRYSIQTGFGMGDLAAAQNASADRDHSPEVSTVPWEVHTLCFCSLDASSSKVIWFFPRGTPTNYFSPDSDALLF